MTTALESLQAMLDQALAPVPQTPSPVVVPPAGDEGLDPRLHDYQKAMVRHMWDNPRAAELVDMGLGKTFATLQALTPDHLPALVVAPKRVAEQTWPTEVAKWRPDLSIAVAAGSPAKRAAALASGSDIVAIGKDNVGDLKPGQFRTYVLDELSSFKSRGVRWKALDKVTKDAPYVFGLTGTPSPNGYMDLWAQMFLVDRGEALGKHLGSVDPRWRKPGNTAYFRERYFVPARTHKQTGVVIEWKMRPGAKEEIEQALSKTCLSMRAVDHLIDHKEPFYNEVVVPLDRKTQKVYDTMLETLVAQVESGEVLAANAGVMTGKLSQICAGFLYGDANEEDQETTVLHHNRIDAAVEVVQGAGSPVLTYYRFVWEREALMAAFAKEGIDVHTIDEPGVIDAWNRGEVQVLLAHPASAGHGLNLQHGGHHVLWVSREWALELWQQANARVARQGQKHPVVIHYLHTPSWIPDEPSVDEALDARLRGKANVQESLKMALRRD